MEGTETLNAPGGPNANNPGFVINGMTYSYSIMKAENEQLLIKLFDTTENSDFYFTYEASTSQLLQDMKFLVMCENLDEMINALNKIFLKGNAKVEEKDGEFFIELKLEEFSRKVIILLTKHEVEKPKNEIEIKIKKLEKEFRILLNKFEELKTKKENIIKEIDIRNIIKEMIMDKNIKIKLFEEFEQMLLSKYNLNNIPKSNNVHNEIITKIQKEVNAKEQNINNQIINIKKQLKENIEYLNKMNNNNINNNNKNYILLQVKIEQKDINRSIKLFQQNLTYKYLYNFEKDDIETIIDNQIVPIKYKNTKCFFESDDNSPNCELSQELEHKLNECYEFYWNFSEAGIHNVKIVFNKKLSNCKYLFHNCVNIYKIDCSNFDCSQITDCSCMFNECKNVVEINLGNLDFSLSNDFGNMFANCCNLEKIDISKLNTKNSKSFYYMFYNCKKLKELNVSNIKTTNCQNIMHMFQGCESLESIDMMNWDMKNIKHIKLLLNGCKSLKNIKINFNNEIASCDKKDEILDGLPEGGSFIWKKGVNCTKFLSLLPVSWNRMQE